MATIVVVAAVVVFGIVSPASATWSIVGVDPETGQVGVAMASCIPASALGNDGEVLVPVALAPGEAAGVAQGSVDAYVAAEAKVLLIERVPLPEVVPSLVDDDEASQVRQYGFVSLLSDGESTAQFTGADVGPVAGSRSGEYVAVQGVTLANSEVLDATLEAFVEARGAGEGLAESLAVALQAGSERGGDSRCGEQSALFAHLVVARATDEPDSPQILLTVMVDEGDGQNPAPLLTEALAQGRSGWIDYGTRPPRGISRLLVLTVALVMAVGAGLLLRAGMGRNQKVSS